MGNEMTQSGQINGPFGTFRSGHGPADQKIVKKYNYVR